MKNSKPSFIRNIFYHSFILGFIFLFTACNNSPSEDKTNNTETDEIVKFDNIIWNVKAIHPDGQTLDIKAFDKDGNTFDVKAIQDSDQDSFLDVKAIGDKKELPVKILVSDNKFAPVKAIDRDGVSYDIKAITADGEKLDIKGIGRYGTIVIIKAITKKGDFYGVKAISPTGKLNDIKGIKINAQDRDMRLKGSSIHAHVKAMHPAANEDNFKALPKKKGEYKNNFKRIIWNIKAVTADGKNLDIKAFDAEGNAFDVKATQDSKQHSFMNIKAFVDGGYELPVKIIESSSDEFGFVGAIGRNGTVYNIKAITKDDVKLDIKGISRSGNIINVKAINENGDFYAVKAFSRNGKLNAVKGIKIFERKVEMRIQGNPVYAHLKAINQ